MPNLSMKWKITLIGIIPAVALLFLGAVNTWESYAKYSDSNSIMEKITLVDVTSPLVNFTQKERGATATFLAGGMSHEELSVRRTKTDERWEKVQETLSKVQVSQEQRRKLKSALMSYSQVRERVDRKSLSTAEAVKSYTQTVYVFLDMQSEFSEEIQKTKMAHLSPYMTGLRIIEEAKEAGGKLRAKMSAAFAADAPLSDEQLLSVESLKSTLTVSLFSPGIRQTAEGMNLRESFRTSLDWETVNEQHKILVTKKAEGDFGVDPKTFFATISRALLIVEEWIEKDRVFIRDRAYAEQKGAASEMLWTSIGLVIFFSLMLFYLTYTVKETNRSLSNIASLLNRGSSKVTEISEELNSASTNLANSTTQQAAALTETVTSINEINSMVDQNTKAAKTSEKLSMDCKKAASEGVESVKQVVNSVRMIESGNKDIIDHVNNVKDELGQIAQLVSDIGDKTAVINDIVFQTKLLSFNASVEAARAGEHGRGFAVVAEEIGSLASMSGKAANEISSILTVSIDRVKSVAKDSEQKSSVLAESSRDRIAKGIEFAGGCEKTFEGILKKVSELSSSVTSIANASQEQGTGVREVNSAMQELDDSNQSNTKTTSEVSDSAGALNTEAVSLKRSVGLLSSLISGQGEAIPFSQSETAKPSFALIRGKSSSQERPKPNSSKPMARASGSDVYVAQNSDEWEEL